MKAIAFSKSLPIENPEALIDCELSIPEPKGFDLLIKVQAVSVNPVDYKARLNMPPETGQCKVLGYDGVGEVSAIGESVSRFKEGDKVYYAGDLTRSGSNAEFQLVDERIVGRKPNSLTDSQAAALPLTTITAWELLFEKLGLSQQVNKADNPRPVLLVTAAAGGVGSILLQLGKQLTNAVIIGTASRLESQHWVKELGADHVINHKLPLAKQLADLGFEYVTHVASLNGTEQMLSQLVDVLVPFGNLAVIEGPEDINMQIFKTKSLSLHWEFMFTKSMYSTKDIHKQHELLNTVADMIDAGQLHSTVGEHLGTINAKNLRLAHAKLESGSTIGKLVLEGF
jgi:zinc-binding alcohol dehydrogenase family protein